MQPPVDFTQMDALIFDLGGVVINLNYQKTFDAFAALGRQSSQSIGSEIRSKNLFDTHGNGDLSNIEFREILRKLLITTAPDHQIDEAFNGLLCDIPIERIHLLQELRKKYRLFLLSNTNEIHINKVNEILFETSGLDNLKLLFEKVYYSYELKLSKPDVRIYQKVIDDNNLNPSRTAFIDDLPENVAGAGKAGLKGILVSPAFTILELFKNVR